MSRFQKINSIIISTVMIIAAVIMILMPDTGYYIMLGILSIALLVNGIRSMIQYFTMARHMVGGLSIFIRGVITIDLALFTMSLTDINPRYIMIYLLLYYIFLGVIDILRAFEAKRFEAPHWRLRFVKGAVTIIIAIVGIVFSKDASIVVIVYSIGLIYSAIARIISAFRRRKLVFIQ